jgi:hypothetical protein
MGRAVSNSVAMFSFEIKKAGRGGISRRRARSFPCPKLALRKGETQITGFDVGRQAAASGKAVHRVENANAAVN